MPHSATRGTDAHIQHTHTASKDAHDEEGRAAEQSDLLSSPRRIINQVSDFPSYNEISHHVLVALVKEEGEGTTGGGSRWSAGSACYVGSAWDPLSVSIELCVHHAVVARGGGGGGGSAPPV